MNDELIADLKQFIAATMSQQLAQQSEELRGEFHAASAITNEKLDEANERIDQTNKKIDNLAAYVADALDASNEANQAQFRQHDKRLTRLERKIGLVA